MEFFRIHKTIPFMKYRHILNAISLVSFVVAGLALYSWLDVLDRIYGRYAVRSALLFCCKHRTDS